MTFLQRMFKVIIACMLVGAASNYTEKIMPTKTLSQSIQSTINATVTATATRTSTATATATATRTSTATNTPIVTSTATKTPSYSRTVSPVSSPSNSPSPSASQKSLRKNAINIETLIIGEWAAYTFLVLTIIVVIIVITAIIVYSFKKSETPKRVNKYDIESNSVIYMSESSEGSPVRYRSGRSPSHNTDMYLLPR